MELLSDMAGKAPLYRNSPAPRDMVNHITKDPILLQRVSFKEMRMEYFAMESQCFITGDERTLEDLFVDTEDSSHGNACLNVMATRIATVFASLREFPLIRYRVAKSLDVTSRTTFPDLITTKLAAGIWNHLLEYKTTIPNFPETETCELLILDRTVDQIAPIIHEWFYDAMCHELLSMHGNKFVHEVQSKTGVPPDKKEVLLDEHDPIWLELRHAHIADASERLHEKMTKFSAKNKMAKIQSLRDGGKLSTRDLQEIVRAIPEYSEQIDKLSLHVDIVGKIYEKIDQLGLKGIGQLEQDIVFGYAGLQEVIKFLKQENATRENKLRLLIILSVIYPEKFEGENCHRLMKLAKLPVKDMEALHNMRLLGESADTTKGITKTFSMKFNIHKRKRANRKERNDTEEKWQLSRFYPMIEELVELLSKGELSEDDYPCINGTSDTSAELSPTPLVKRTPAHSVKSRRTRSWAQRQYSDSSNSSSGRVLEHSSSSNKMGRRIFVFIIGGATRSELRACYKLTGKLDREVILGSSSIEDPQQFITKLKQLSVRELS
ncbi:hypothetical protein Tsubulata_018104 [Turnera subulata]|uniref:SNARE-interacting protein KEULE n=1 Tax=Turnera subulata TaxID=218843 RepID=A0A9Q0FI85_9ROSI|nr:hypothetical protein Tsubulata_018104 [Turnera subulata]